MTVSLNVKKVAIIGAGPAGIVTLNELLHTSSNGSSTITSPTTESPLPSSPAFEEIVVFEQSDNYGGVWQHTPKIDEFPVSKQYADLAYNKPSTITTKYDIPTIADLEGHDATNPVIKQSTEDKINKKFINSAVYDNLFTNIPNKLMRFSSGFDIDIDNADGKSINIFEPFVRHPKVLEYINKYVAANDLEKYIRFNTSVEKVVKDETTGKWHVTVVQLDKNKNTEKWYSETFDSVVVAVGRFNIPFIPKIPGLPEFAEKYNDVVLHTKSLRKVSEFDNKKVLLIGSSISAVDILQYLIPRAKQVHLSRNSNESGELSNPRDEKWFAKVLSDDTLGVIKHPRIAEFDADNNKIIFTDGTTESGFDKIIFATGYHLHYPFLNDHWENHKKNYIKVGSGLAGVDNYALNKVENVYYYTFTIGEPTLVHIGLTHSPLFFLLSEANAAAVAGVWTNNSQLPSIEEQYKWVEKRIEGKKSGFQYVEGSKLKDWVNGLYELAPEGRFNASEVIDYEIIKDGHQVLYNLFYKYARGELTE